MKRDIICWFEIYVKNIERAKKFYSAVLETKFTETTNAPGDASKNMKISFFSSAEEQMEGVSGALVGCLVQKKAAGLV